MKKREEIDFVDYVYLSPKEKSEMISFARFVVKFKPDITEAEVETLNKENNIEIVRKNAYRNRYVLRMKSGSKRSLYSIVQKYSKHPKVEYAVPDLLIKGHSHGTPNDTYFSNQFYLTSTNVPYAWDITKGSSTIIVTVIDDGGEVHPDLPSTRIIQGFANTC